MKIDPIATTIAQTHEQENAILEMGDKIYEVFSAFGINTDSGAFKGIENKIINDIEKKITFAIKSQKGNN